MVQGDQGTWITALIAGRTKVIHSPPSGDEVLIAVRGPGVNGRRTPGHQLTLQEPLPEDGQRLGETLAETSQIALFFDFVARYNTQVDDRLDERTRPEDSLEAADSFAVVAVKNQAGPAASYMMTKQLNTIFQAYPVP